MAIILCKHCGAPFERAGRLGSASVVRAKFCSTQCMRAPRPIEVAGNDAIIPLTKGYEAVIDAADIGVVEGKRWVASVKKTKDGDVKAVYAVCGHSGTTIAMHQLIIGKRPGKMVDHIDGDGLNNRRCNLRHVSNSENQFNRRLNRNSTSGVKGVSFAKKEGKWRAAIVIGGSKKVIGYYECIEAARGAVMAAIDETRGPFARHE